MRRSKRDCDAARSVYGCIVSLPGTLEIIDGCAPLTPVDRMRRLFFYMAACGGGGGGVCVCVGCFLDKSIVLSLSLLLSNLVVFERVRVFSIPPSERGGVIVRDCWSCSEDF